jgi:hypothetical protein
MEITNISGPDTVPRGFSPEPPRQEEPARNEAQPVNRNPEPSENNKGTTIDTYA